MDENIKIISLLTVPVVLPACVMASDEMAILLKEEWDAAKNPLLKRVQSWRRVR